MNDIPVVYEEVNPFEEKLPEVYFRVTKLTDLQVKNMVRLKAVVPKSQNNGIPFIKTGIKEPIFNIRDSLEAYISMLRIFKRDGVELVTPTGSRQVIKEDLIKFIFE